MSSNIIAINIETKNIVAIVAALNKKGNIQILAVEELPIAGIKNGEIKNKKEVAKTIQEIIKKLHVKQIETINNIYVANHNRFLTHTKSSISIPVNSKKIAAKHMKQLYEKTNEIKFPRDKQLIDLKIDNFFVENQKIIDSPLGLSGKTLKANFCLITTKKSIINSIRNCVETKGFKLRKLYASSLISSGVLLSNREMINGVALVDFEEETTEFLIYFEKILQHFLVLPFGWRHIIHDIQTACKIKEKDAVELFNAISKDPNRRSFNLPKEEGKVTRKIDNKTLKYIIYARLFEIMEGIDKHVKFSKITYKIKSGIIITGRYTEMIFLRNLLQKITKLEVKYKRPNFDFINETNFDLKKPKFNAVLGITKDVFNNDKNTNFNNVNKPVIKKMLSSLFE